MRRFAIPLGIACTVAFLAAAVHFGPRIVIQGFGPEPADIVDGVPLGSKVSELDRYLDGELDETHATVKPAHQESEVPYSVWKATHKNKDHFSGEIMLFDMGLFSSEMYGFIYKNGRLVEKDWGFLPG